VDWCSSTRRVLCCSQAVSKPACAGWPPKLNPLLSPRIPKKRRTTRWPLSPALGNIGVPRAKARRIDDPSNAFSQHCGGPPDQHWRGCFETVIAVGRSKRALGHGATSSPTHEEDSFESADRQRASRATSVEKTVLKKVHTILSSRRPRRGPSNLPKIAGCRSDRAKIWLLCTFRHNGGAR
jgi:hypothetical protein